MSAKLQGVVNQQLQKIERLAKQKEEELEKAQFEKYYHLFDLAVRAIKRERVMLYGGTAINDLLPPALRFYSPTKLPDIDVFTVDAEKVAKRVVKFFKEHGYTITSYTPALHPGTFKVFLNGLQVLDITDVPDKTFRHLVRKAVKGPTGIRIVDPEYLRMTLHLMLAQSNDAYRWTKNFERMVAFYEAFPVPKKAKKDADAEAAAAAPVRQLVPAEVKHVIQEMLKRSEYVVFGQDVLKGQTYILTKGDVTDTAKELLEHAIAMGLDKKDLGISEVYATDSIVQNHVFLTYKGRKVLGIYHAHACMSYVVVGHVRMASIHAMIAMYMMMSLTIHKHTDRNLLRAMANTATLTLMEEIRHPSRKKQLQQFILECYGQHTGVVTLRREALLRRYGKKL